MIQVILIDDEPLALKNLEIKLAEFDSIEIVKSFTSVKELLHEVPHLDFQVAFLDIEMPELNGLELAKKLYQMKQNLHIVFITAYRDYALEAFELQSMDYLQKPFTTVRLAKTIKRLHEQLQLETLQSNHSTSHECVLKIQCLGDFTVQYNDENIHWRTSKAKILFAYLFLHHHIPVPRDTVIDHIWGENDYQKAKTQLHTTISYLRTTLASIGYSNVLLYTNESYVLHLENYDCDAFELEQLMQNFNGINQANIKKVESIIESYQGDYMQNIDFPWVTAKANAIRNLFSQLLCKLIDYYTAINNQTNLEHALQLLLKHNPYSEDALQQLMLFYKHNGSRAEAVNLFRKFKKKYITDLGIQPSEKSYQIFKSII